MSFSTYPPNFLCSLSGAVMTTPVTLTATGQSFELSVLTKALRKQPLTDPLTGARIDSNAMEINFDLQAQIEDYHDAQCELKLNSVSLNMDDDDSTKQNLSHQSPPTPIAPPIDFALDFMHDDSSDDDTENITPSPVKDVPPGFESTQDDVDLSFPVSLEDLSRTNNLDFLDDDDSHHRPESEQEIEEIDTHILHLPDKSSLPQEVLLPPQPPIVSLSSSDILPSESTKKNSDDGASLAYKQRKQDINLEHDFYDSLERVSFSGPPSQWSYSMGNADTVVSLLKCDGNEYADRKLLNNTSTIARRAKALCKRNPFMWGFETDLKSSSQAIVSLMNSMNKDEDELAEDNPTDRSGRAPLGPLGPPGATGARGRGAGNSGGGRANQMHREGGNTALHVAVWNGHMNVVECLVEAGAGLDTKNANNCTPLMLGCRFGHFEIVKYLLEHGSTFRMIRKDDICSQGKVDDFNAKKQINALLNSHRRKAGLSYLR